MPEAAVAEKKINQTDVRLIKGDLTMLDVDAFVFYAQPDLQIGSGFGTAISVRGGPTIQKELEGKGPLATGEALVTEAGNLKAKHIIHVVGPRFQEEDMEGKLRTTMQNTLKVAEENGFETIAFPPMGSGFYGIPIDMCTKVMFKTIQGHVKGETKLKEVVICVMDNRDYGPFETGLSQLN